MSHDAHYIILTSNSDGDQVAIARTLDVIETFARHAHVSRSMMRVVRVASRVRFDEMCEGIFAVHDAFVAKSQSSSPMTLDDAMSVPWAFANGRSIGNVHSMELELTKRGRAALTRICLRYIDDDDDGMDLRAYFNALAEVCAIDHAKGEEELSANAYVERFASTNAKGGDGDDGDYLGTYCAFASLNDDISENAKKAFFINAYNDGFRAARALERRTTTTTTTRERVKMLVQHECGIKLGDRFYSLDDIEHGLLRANAAKPSSSSSSSRAAAAAALFRFVRPKKRLDDERAKIACATLDPRIHFALNRGTTSSPAIRRYVAEDVDAQLDVATREFLRATTTVKKDARTIEVAKVFKWYARDFGTTTSSVASFIADGLGDDARARAIRAAVASGRARLAYAEYDWTFVD